MVLVVRDTGTGARVRREIGERVQLATIDVRRCDVSDLDDVRRFAAELDADPGERRVDVLVHNAGAMPPQRTGSEHGADTTAWVAAAEPARPGGQLWHDRRVRPTQLLPRTRTGHTERERMWGWVAERLGLGPASAAALTGGRIGP